MSKNYFVKSSRKKARASAVVKPGVGNIRINNKALDCFCKGYKKDLIIEPTLIAEDEFKKFNYFISVSGGGIMGQIQTIRSCIAKGILLANGSKDIIKDKFIKYDRHLIIDDARQKEAKKQLGRSARTKKQHSKR